MPLMVLPRTWRPVTMFFALAHIISTWLLNVGFLSR